MPDEEDPEEIIDDIYSVFDNLQNKFSESAATAGEDKEKIKGLKPYWSRFVKYNTTDEKKASIIASGLHALSEYRDEAHNYAEMAIPITKKLELLDLGVNTTAGITGTTSSIVFTKFVIPEEVTQPIFTNRERVIELLNRMDPALARTYEEIHQVLYGTKADPERGALFLVRQTFDHLFSILAPDTEVRKSEYFQIKTGERKDLVTRMERAQFAANTKIKAKTKGAALIASSKHMIDVYDLLNDAHDRGELDVETARQALREMNALLEEWIISYFE